MNVFLPQIREITFPKHMFNLRYSNYFDLHPSAIVWRTVTQITVVSFFITVRRTCYCEGHCPHGLSNGTCEVRPGGKCFADIQAYIEDGEEYAVMQYGCLPPDEASLMQVRYLGLGDNSFFFIKSLALCYICCVFVIIKSIL